MRKTLSILAVVLFSMGLFSCEGESTAEDQALYETQATDGDEIKTEDRGN
ncbi:MAG: hypothetical protein WBG90_19070 [Saonia sp.]